MRNKRTKESELDNIYRKNVFIVICSIEPKDDLPMFSVMYKRSGDKVLKYSVHENKQIDEINMWDYHYDSKREIEYASFFMVCKGDPFEFIRFIESSDFEAYYKEVAKYDIDNVLLPAEFTKERVDERLEEYSKNTFKYSYDKTIDKIKISQYITWGITLIGLGMSFYNTFFGK